MLWIEDIGENTLALPFLTNSRVDMVSYGDPHKVVVRRNTFSALPVDEMEVKTKSRKNHVKEEEEKKIPKVNLILSHFNQTFLILDPQIGPQTLKHTHCT
jgi:hypothetical protein